MTGCPGSPMQFQKPQGNCTFSDASQAASNLHKLQAELARINILIQREVHRWQLAGQDAGDIFRGLYVSDAQANALLARPAFLNWGQTVDLSPDEEEAWQKALQEAESQAQEGRPSCLEHLAAVFHLDRFDIDALLVCLAPCLDLRYERLYGYLQDDLTRKRAGVSLLLDLLCPPGPEKLLKLERFSTDAPLIRQHLLEFSPEQGQGKPPLLACSLTVNETVCAWMLGYYQPGSELAGRAVLVSPQENLADALIAGDWLNKDLLYRSLSGEMVHIFTGPDQTAQEAAACQLAAHTGKPLLVIDLCGLAEEEPAQLPVVQMALRDARLFHALPLFSGWDALLHDGKTLPALLSEVCSFPGNIIISGQEAWQATGLERKRLFRWQEFPIPTYHRRRVLWDHFLGESRQDGYVLDGLAGQFALSSGQIRDAAASVRDTVAFSTDVGAQPDTQSNAACLFAAARAHSNPSLARLAHKLNLRYGWNDIILPADALAQLREIVAAVRGRPQVLDEWGLGRKLVSSRGVTVLFSGQPGTGKTMAAEIIAGELGLDLYKIDLSTVVSKYVGETEKNMERIFSEAESSNAILFFDEADALFGKRSEVRDSHDRYANIEISYLLQRMEAYDGVTILATNLRSNLDEAFTRRLQFAVDFPFPDEADRLRIWQALFPAALPRAADLNLNLLAERFKLAGGSIRNILVSAAYLAASDGGMVTMAHLMHSTRRELQKMGRLTCDEEPQADMT